MLQEICILAYNLNGQTSLQLLLNVTEENCRCSGICPSDIHWKPVV